ncbi:serine proteinase stubble-like [Myzus persicae]|uniref:serine proteinase stubble-like n=1 Tax=Myzus persicae TaxID=13164 RepID=UPI000B9348C8|nr:serine proteinase stubble-like [Myzus persicae]
MTLAATMGYLMMILFILSIIVDVKTIPVEIQELNTSILPPKERRTDVYSLTTMNPIEAEKDSHLNMSNYEDVLVTHNPPGVDGLTLTPSLITLPVKTHVSNPTGAPPDEKSTYVSPSTMMLTTTDSIDIENGPHNMSNNEGVTLKPPGVDGSTLIPSWFILPVEIHVSNNASSPLSEQNSTDVDSSSTTISILDPVKAVENITFVAPRDIEVLVTHNISVINGLNISSLYSVTININNTSGGSFTENLTHIYNSEIILTTTTDFTNTEYAAFNMSNYKDVCGRQLIPIPRIVGGDKVSFGEWPWQISLRHKKKYIHKCGAVLFNENWAITTAHCVKNISMNDIHLLLGKNDFSVKDEPYGFQIRKLQTVIIHPKYNTHAMEHDLALLRFDEPVKFQPNILPVCIPEDDSNFEGLSAHITGWGTLYYGGLSPDVLQEVTVPIINNSVCETMFRAAGYVKKIPDTFICAGLKDGGYDACKGDSGGPMVVQRRDNRWVVAGIIAWGMRCGEPNSPGVYMRISKFTDWINKIISQS